MQPPCPTEPFYLIIKAWMISPFCQKRVPLEKLDSVLFVEYATNEATQLGVAGGIS